MYKDPSDFPDFLLCLLIHYTNVSHPQVCLGKVFCFQFNLTFFWNFPSAAIGPSLSNLLAIVSILSSSFFLSFPPSLLPVFFSFFLLSKLDQLVFDGNQIVGLVLLPSIFWCSKTTCKLCLFCTPSPNKWK